LPQACNGNYGSKTVSFALARPLACYVIKLSMLKDISIEPVEDGFPRNFTPASTNCQ
jgi:hypothetical protein